MSLSESSETTPPPPQEPTKFELLVERKELKPDVAEKLHYVLSNCDIVLLCDDSSSMSQAISEDSTDPFAVKKSTRWSELKKLASILIEFVIAINPDGLELWFFSSPHGI